MEPKVIDQPSTAQPKQSTTDRKNIDQLKGYKKFYEPKWYLAQAFYEGVHFANPRKDKNGQWDRITMGKNKSIREVPKAKKQVNAVRNLIMKRRQRPVVYPDVNVIIADSQGDEAKRQAEEDKALEQSRYVDYYMNEVMKLGRHKKKLIKYAALYNVAYIQILNEDGKKSFAVYDPFEVSIYPNISNINEYPMLVKHVSHRFEDLIGNDLYDQAVITKLAAEGGDGKYSDSQYKNAMMRERYGKAPEDTVIIDELYEIVKAQVNPDGTLYVEEKIEEETGVQVPAEQAQEGNVEEGDEAMPAPHEEERMRIRAYIGTDLVREEVTNLKTLPFSMFCWGDEAYATSFMEDLMPLNKAYDIFVSKLEHKAKKMDTGRYAIQAGENTKVLTTNDGEYVRYKRIAPKVMEEAGVPNAFMETINLLEDDMKEIGVALTGSGGLPAGVEAWRAIESIKEIDYGSIGLQQENLDECLTDVAEKLTEMLAYDQTTIENVAIKDEKGVNQPMKVIGKRGAEIIGKEGIGADVLVLDPSRKTKVEVESEMTWTEAGKRELTLDLVREGLMPKEMAIDVLKFGNSRDVMQRLVAEMTMGKSIIDAPDFKLLPPDLQQAIVKYLAQGGTITDGGAITNNE